MKRVHDMSFGASVLSNGKVSFRLWAPAARTVELCLENQVGDEIVLPMNQLTDGWFQRETSPAQAEHGTLYRYRIDGALLVPDPASRANPHDVHGPSQVVDAAAFVWKDDDWHEAVVRWHLGDGAQLTLLANLGDGPVEADQHFSGTAFYLSQADLLEVFGAGYMPPWCAAWFIEDVRA